MIGKVVNILGLVVRLDVRSVLVLGEVQGNVRVVDNRKVDLNSDSQSSLERDRCLKTYVIS